MRFYSLNARGLGVVAGVALVVCVVKILHDTDNNHARGERGEPPPPAQQAQSRHITFKDGTDVLRFLREAAVVRIQELDKIGVTPAFKVTFADGRWAIFKPQVCHSPPECHLFGGDANYREILAFHVSVLLGFNRVPPVTGRTFPHELLLTVLPSLLARPSWGRYRSASIRSIWDKAITRGITHGGLVVGCVILGLDNLQDRTSEEIPERDISEVQIFDFLTMQQDRGEPGARGLMHNMPVLGVGSVGEGPGGRNEALDLLVGVTEGKSPILIDNGRSFIPDGIVGGQVINRTLALDDHSCRFAKNLCERLESFAIPCGRPAPRQSFLNSKQKAKDALLKTPFLNALRASLAPDLYASWVPDDTYLGLQERAHVLGQHVHSCIERSKANGGRGQLDVLCL